MAKVILAMFMRMMTMTIVNLSMAINHYADASAASEEADDDDDDDDAAVR